MNGFTDPRAVTGVVRDNENVYRSSYNNTKKILLLLLKHYLCFSEKKHSVCRIPPFGSSSVLM